MHKMFKNSILLHTHKKNEFQEFLFFFSDKYSALTLIIISRFYLCSSLQESLFVVPTNP